MRVLITADTLGGVWTYARELVTGLVRRGVQVTLVSFGEIPGPTQTQWMDGLHGLDYLPTAFRLEWMLEAEHDLNASMEYVAAVVRDSKPDLLHLNQYGYGVLKTSIPKVVVAHSDVLTWWRSVHEEEPKDTHWLGWYRDTVAAGLEGATAVVAPSRWMLDALSGIYGAPQHASVIYNGRTPTLFNPHMSKEPYGLSVGRIWDSGKQVTLLAEADAPVPVYIAGSSEHPDIKLRNELKLSGARARVFFKGQQSEAELRQLYGRAAVYAATSRYEPFGLAPVEAALSRCALVCNDIPTFRELWGDDAIFFERNSASSLAGALERLMNDDDLRVAYANRAYHRALERYTTDRMVNDYLVLYQSLVHAGAMAA
jgi:glycogen synthase